MTAQREWFEKDYYKVLGVPENATAKEITSAYRKLAKQHHPDAHPGSEERFKEISAAYDVLGDAAKRAEYDEVRRLGAQGVGGFGPGGPGAGGGSFRVEDLGDLGDLFGGLFGQRGGRRTRTANRRGADVEAELHLSFEEAVRGVTSTVHVTGDVRCHTCHGSGAAPGTHPEVCPLCHGSGNLANNQGLFSLSQVCPQCNGRGTIVQSPCATCHGTGTERRTRDVKVRIPAGVEDGQRIRVKGRGGQGTGSAPAGDLYVVTRVTPHPVFGRKGANLTLEVPVTFAEAALGTTLTVPTLESTVTLRIPPGTPTGRTLRVKGRGVPSGGKRSTPGDLLVTVAVSVPAKLTDEQREALERYAAVADAAPRAHLDAAVEERR